MNDLNNTMSFHLHLLSRIIDINQYPLIKLIIENNISNEEYDELFRLLDLLNNKFELQKDEGLLDYTSLLVHFAGMLNMKLKPDETITALKKEGYFPSLMTEFVLLIEKEQKKKDGT